MLASLLASVAWNSLHVCLELVRLLAKAALQRESQPSARCSFYECTVYHVRTRPLQNSFRYPVRVAVLSLDEPPGWFCEQAQDHLTACEARSLAGTAGPVLLLTNPISAGYTQNPISVYYCHDAAGRLARCIAEVTNTPWGARLTFAFDPAGADVPKALHVSPFMDMRNRWHLEAPLPRDKLALTVAVSHPEHGSYFTATLRGQLSSQPGLRNEEAGLAVLWRYGFQPQRIAFWIYWQAAKLLWQGASFYPPPPWPGATAEGGRLRRAAAWPWTVQQ